MPNTGGGQADEERWNWAHEVGRGLLEKPLPRRWQHSIGVGRQAVSLDGIVGEDAGDLVVAALLHDVGYSPELVVTGFHPIDGARYLRDGLGVAPRIVNLVAHHSCAAVEAEMRHFTDELAEFDLEEPLLVDALIYCDMTTTPDGALTDVAGRLAEITDRYGADSLVGRFVEQAGPDLRSATARTQARLAAAQPR